MNYSKDSRKKSNESNSETKSKTKKTKKKAKVSALRILFIIIIISIFAVVGAGLGIFVGIIKSAPDISTLELKPTTHFTSFVYDQNGEEIDRLSSGENRIYVELDQIPKHFQDAVIAIEDERFYDHKGIDIKGIFRAIFTNLKTMDFNQGASTITQQLIKNNVFKTNEKKIVRKIQEQYLAIQFEQIYTKELILEYYLNTFLLGHGEYGVQAAANFYFGKNASELTLAESVVLAGITKAPTRYSPILNPENNWERAQLILDKMESLGMITAEEKAAALAENPYKNIVQRQEDLSESSAHSYFVDAVMEQVIEDLQTEKNMTKTQANNLVYGGGIQIYTTLDQNMQNIVDTHMKDDNLFPPYVEYVINYAASIEKPDGTVSHRGGKGVIKSDSEEEIKRFQEAKLEEWGAVEGDKIYGEVVQLVPQTQAAFVVMDHHNGHVKALSGGRGEKYGDRVFNRATQALRQPGSVFKVLASYAPALDMGILSPGSIIVDEPYTVGKYTPNNWYTTGYRGPSTVRQGIYDSMNILAVKALEMVGLDTAYDYLMNFGFTTLSETNDKYYPLALGGISKGVTPLELNASYATIANQGTYIEPILYTQVLDMEGNVLLDNSAPETRTVIKDSTASMLTDMMEDTVTRGTAGTVRRTFSGMPIAGKTGTTSDNKDFLFSGYTPYYTATVWMGYDDPQYFNIGKPQKHQELWATIMKDIHKDLPSKPFEKITTGYTKTKICAASGKIPTELCELDPNHVFSSDYFNANHVPTEYCDRHVEVKVCTVSGKIANEFCPPETVQTQVTVKNPNPEAPDQVNPEDLCDVHTATVMEPETPGLPGWPDWPSWPDLGGNGNGNNGNGNNGNGNNGNGNNGNGNNGNGNSNNDNSDTNNGDTIPEETIPPSEDDDFYIPQG